MKPAVETLIRRLAFLEAPKARFTEGSNTFDLRRQAFLLIVLLASCWCPEPPFINQQLDVLDLFAGRARVGRLAEQLGYQTRSMDIAFGHHGESGGQKNNPMDLNECGGLVPLDY